MSSQLEGFMTDQKSHDALPLLEDVYSVLAQADALGSRDPWQTLAPRLAELRDRAEDLRSEDVATELSELRSVFADAKPQAAAGGSWAAYRERLQRAYDTLVGALRGLGLYAPVHRPTNYARTAMHVTTALTCLLLVEHVLSPLGMIVTAAVGAVACWSMELGRIFSSRLNEFLLWSMSAVAHPHERRHVNSATWYTTALLVLALLFTPKVVVVALAILGLADPAAGFVGRRWGRVRLVNGRSLEGTTTFFVVGTLAGLAALSIWHPEVRLGVALLIALAAAFTGAITELFSRRIDDNLSIPIAAAAGAWVVAAAL
jgi:dolichol kinase